MQLSDAHTHLEKYWQLSKEFYKRGDFALASFLSITLMEEIGKLIILGNYKLSNELDKKGFYNHQAKYLYAIYQTLLVNSRVSRVYGNLEKQFADWFIDKELFDIRNSALYLDLNEGNIIIPDKAVSKDVAFLLVCFAGEIYGDAQGSLIDSNSDSWKRIINEVDMFREENRIHS